MACLAWKCRTAATKDARRRLTVVLAGALVSFPLYLLLSFIARVRRLDVEGAFPHWLFGTSYVLYCVFPLTIAYAIVVQRAMDVRLILRQSVQYTLAQRDCLADPVERSFVRRAGHACCSPHAELRDNRFVDGRRCVGHFPAERSNAPFGGFH
jgi:hypothetical protein